MVWGHVTPRIQCLRLQWILTLSLGSAKCCLFMRCGIPRASVWAQSLYAAALCRLLPCGGGRIF